MKYLIISRGEDEPQIKLIDKETFEILLKYSWDNYIFLNECPDLMEFPSNSVFIMAGTVVSK